MSQSFCLCHQRASVCISVPLLRHFLDDGVDELLVVLLKIPAGGVEEVYIDVTASTAAGTQEIFLVEVFSATAEILPPLDNTTSIIIDQPANLELVYELYGVIDGAVGYGQQFAMVVDLLNNGTAPTADGIYSVTTGGVELGDNYTPVGSMAGGSILYFLLSS